MKFLTDENIANSLVKDLRKQGFDVKDVKEENLQGTGDKEIFDIAQKEDRIIVTHDKDFANISMTSGMIHNGIILIRCKNQSPDNVSLILSKVLNLGLNEKIKDSLVIVSEDKVIIRKRES